MQPGAVLLHYRLLESLGAGGGGVVWRAVDTRLGREVAIKLLPEAIAGDPEILARLEREARAVATLNHPNIVTLYSIEESQGTRFLTMELVRGLTLDRLIPEGGLPLERLLDFAVPLADAIAAAHEGGVTHRDLKPRNIMVTDDGRVKVLDFGLALHHPRKAADVSELTTQTQGEPGSLQGSLPYMAPEQLLGRPLDARTDIFALGVVLYEMATGRRPFGGDSPAGLIASILRDVPSPLPAALPGELGQIIERCLEKDPRRRLQAALDLRNDLEDLRRRGPAAVQAYGPSVAVLPFVDMSREKDQDYFCEGMAEEIISALARIESLRVASRTSSFLFKGIALDCREIGRRLQVSTLLEGSVRKAGERLRITAELTDVATGYHLWSERFDRELRDVFAIQEEIAHSIARSLRVTLGAREREALRRVPTRDVEAYDYYLRGRKYYFEYRRRGMEFALEMFSHAIERDPDYARAYAGIAECCAFLYMYVDRSEANRERAEAASGRALELDPELAEAHASRGVALSLGGRDEEAEAAFETAIGLDPKLFEALYFYARHAFAQGQVEKAARLYEQASAARPEDYQALLLLGVVYRKLGRPGEAEAARRRGLHIAEERLKLRPDDVRARYMGANALVALGERDRGLAWARTAQALDPEESMVLYNLGCIYALAASPEEALDCLQRAVDRGLTQKGWFAHDSDLDAVRQEPRFQELLRRLA